MPERTCTDTTSRPHLNNHPYALQPMPYSLGPPDTQPSLGTSPLQPYTHPYCPGTHTWETLLREVTNYTNQPDTGMNDVFTLLRTLYLPSLTPDIRLSFRHCTFAIERVQNRNSSQPEPQ